VPENCSVLTFDPEFVKAIGFLAFVTGGIDKGQVLDSAFALRFVDEAKDGVQTLIGVVAEVLTPLKSPRFLH